MTTPNVTDNSGNKLWRINPNDPSDTVPPYGEVGAMVDKGLPSDQDVPTAMTCYNGELYISTSDEMDLPSMLSLTRYGHHPTGWFTFTVTDIVVIGSCSAVTFVLVLLGVL